MRRVPFASVAQANAYAALAHKLHGGNRIENAVQKRGGATLGNTTVNTTATVAVGEVEGGIVCALPPEVETEHDTDNARPVQDRRLTTLESADFAAGRATAVGGGASLNLRLAGAPVVAATEGQNLTANVTGGTGPFAIYERRGAEDIYLGQTSGGALALNAIAPGEQDTGDRVFVARDLGAGNAATATYTVNIPDAAAYLIGRLENRSFYQAVASLTPICVGAAFRIRATNATARYLLSNESATGGWRIAITSGNTLQLTFRDQGGTPRSRTSIAFTPGDNIMTYYGHYNGIGGGSGAIATSLNGAALSPSGAFTGYTPPAGGSVFRVGYSSIADSFPATDVEFLGWMIGDTAQSDAQAQAWAQAVKAAKRMVAFSAGTSQIWDPRCAMNDIVPNITFAGTNGGASLALGAFSGIGLRRPLVRRVLNPTWAF